MKYLFLALLLTIGCASKGTVIEKLEKGNTRIEGYVENIAVDRQGDRLLIYLRTDDSSVVTAVAENEEKQWVLKKLQAKLLVVKQRVDLIGTGYERIDLIGTEHEGQYAEMAEGVDFIVIAVRYYDPLSEDYAIILTDYGERTMDTVKGMDWGHIMQGVVKKGIRTVAP